MLSKENFDKLNENFLYRKNPENWTGIGDKYWCKNWTFKVRKHHNGTAVMLDTYFESWDSHSYKVTDENIDDFEKIFDFRDVKRISDYEIYEYEDADLYCVATDSGGYSCGRLHWAKKTAEKSKQKLIEKARKEVEAAKRRLEWAEKDLKQLINNGR